MTFWVPKAHLWECLGPFSSHPEERATGKGTRTLALLVLARMGPGIWLVDSPEVPSIVTPRGGFRLSQQIQPQLRLPPPHGARHSQAGISGVSSTQGGPARCPKAPGQVPSTQQGLRKELGAKAALAKASARETGVYRAGDSPPCLRGDISCPFILSFPKQCSCRLSVSWPGPNSTAASTMSGFPSPAHV